MKRWIRLLIFIIIAGIYVWYNNREVFNKVEETQVEAPVINKTVAEVEKVEATSNYVKPTLESFSKAKQILEKQVYNNERAITFYCGCSFDSKKVNQESCGYKNIKTALKTRASKIEWEHIVPAENFWKSFSEWKDGSKECVDGKGKSFKGRKCAEKNNKEFRIMQADIFNLVPAIGEVNGLRSNYDMSNKMNATAYNFCSDVQLYPDYNLFSPKAEKKGDIARIYKYMKNTYPHHISFTKKYEDMLNTWDKEDPISKEECVIYELKKGIAGYTVDLWEETCRKII